MRGSPNVNGMRQRRFSRHGGVQPALRDAMTLNLITP
jgi:hypothetical protein